MKRLTSKPFHARPCLIPRKIIEDDFTAPRGGGCCTPFIVLSPVEIASRFPLPPAGATFLEHSACTKRCSPQLSTNHYPLILTCPVKNPAPQRGRVLHAFHCLIPRKIIFQMILPPPEGAGFLEHCAGTKGCSPHLSTIH